MYILLKSWQIVLSMRNDKIFPWLYSASEYETEHEPVRKVFIRTTTTKVNLKSYKLKLIIFEGTVSRDGVQTETIGPKECVGPKILTQQIGWLSM
jgi:hypothetical protein